MKVFCVICRHADGENKKLTFPLCKETLEIVRSRHKFLVDNIHYSSIAYSLIQHGVISDRHKASIEETQNGFERVGRLLDVLRRRSEEDFRQFVECLEEEGHGLAAGMLQSDYLNKGLYFSFKTRN